MMSSPNWLLFTHLASQNCQGCPTMSYPNYLRSAPYDDNFLFNPSWLLLVTFNVVVVVVVVVVVFMFVGIKFSLRNGLTQLNH